MNQTNYNQTELSYTNPINQSVTEKPQADVMDAMDDAQSYIELIKENISYDHHMKYDGYGEKELYDELFGIICEVVCVKRKSIRVAGEDYPYELVKSRFLKLNSSHLEYVIGCMKETTTKITNIKSYMITALYNAPATINHSISRKCSMICMEEDGMKRVLFKLILPMAFIVIWLDMCYWICLGENGMNWLQFWIMGGFPFGIQKMLVLLIPRNFGIAGSIGVLALDAIIGGMIGVIVLAIKIIAIIREVINIIMELAGKRISC